MRLYGLADTLSASSHVASQTADATPRSPRLVFHRLLFAILAPRQQRNAHRTQHHPPNQTEQRESGFTHPCSTNNRVVTPSNTGKHRRNAQPVGRGRAAIRVGECAELFAAELGRFRTRIHRRSGRPPRRVVLPRMFRAIPEHGARLPGHGGFPISERQLASLDDGGHARPRTGANEDGGIDRVRRTHQHERRANEQQNGRPQAAQCVFHGNGRIERSTDQRTGALTRTWPIDRARAIHVPRSPASCRRPAMPTPARLLPDPELDPSIPRPPVRRIVRRDRLIRPDARRRHLLRLDALRDQIALHRIRARLA